MGSYRSAYEDYYKNINNTTREKKDKKNYFDFGKKGSNFNNPKYGNGAKNNNDKIIDILIKRITRELTGAIILMLFFVGLRYIPSAQIEEMHTKCKTMLNQDFNYSEYIEAFNKMQIGNLQGEGLNIGNITMDDLKIENLKEKTSNFIEYLKSNAKN